MDEVVRRFGRPCLVGATWQGRTRGEVGRDGVGRRRRGHYANERGWSNEPVLQDRTRKRDPLLEAISQLSTSCGVRSDAQYLRCCHAEKAASRATIKPFSCARSKGQQESFRSAIPKTRQQREEATYSTRAPTNQTCLDNKKYKTNAQTAEKKTHLSQALRTEE